MDILERFLKYVSIDTTSDSSKTNTPSTEGQRKLAELLYKEMIDLGLDNIYYDQSYCYLYAVLKGNEALPKIGFVAHLDTSENACGKDVRPNIITNYDGNDIALNDNVILRPDIYPDLNKHIGKTLITTDGRTLLGADDKAGIAEIMSMLQHFSTSKEQHGDILVCFTPDEEIGLGTLMFDKNHFNPDFAYTVDGSGLGEVSYENFNAASATITIKGISTHCGSAKGIMINAGRLATFINSLLPNEIPENTEGYEGFFHLDEITGNVAEAKMKYLIRDFDKNKIEERKQILSGIVNSLNADFNNCIKLDIEDNYFNMYDIINNVPELIQNTLSAISNIGISPEVIPIRGGTDGAELSYLGIPCPNLGTGGHNFHSIYEYVCLEDMEKVSEELVSIVNQFSKTDIKRKIK